MLNLNILIKMMPIQYNHGLYTLDILKLNSMTWYIDNLKKPYYNKYLEHDFRKAKENRLNTYIYNLIKSYSYIDDTDDIDDVRMILKYNENIIGGCSVFKAGHLRYDRETFINDRTLKLSYFVIPEYQNKGIAYNMLEQILELVKKNRIHIGYSNMALNIKRDNIYSMRLAEKLNFKVIKYVDDTAILIYNS